MRESLVILEDAAFRRFLPLAHTRPTYELLCGVMSLRERIERFVGTRALLCCRPHVAEVTAAETGRPVNAERLKGSAPALFVNGRLLYPRALRKALDSFPNTGAWWNGDQLVAARLKAADAGDLLLTLASNDHVFETGMLPSLEKRTIAAHLITYPWELVLANGESIVADFAALGDRRNAGPALAAGAHVLGDDVLIADDARIDPGVVLDARGGPILIGGGVSISAHTRVEGPAAIAAGAQLVGGKIRAGTTIGRHCRVGGEIEESIFHAYSNKYHEGFLGHSYIGEWVNLGALTTNSDLKNTYGPVKVWNDGRLKQTGESKVGSLIGDHAKTGIGTLLDTGTVIGVAANVFGGGLARAKFIPSFSWGSPPSLDIYDPDKCLETMEIVMRRRGKELTTAYREMIDELYGMTENEREFAGISTKH